MNYNKIISSIRKHPIISIGIASAIGGGATYYALRSQSADIFIGCLTETVGGDQRCVKYSYPPLTRIGVVDNKACPSPPPQYQCP